MTQKYGNNHSINYLETFFDKLFLKRLSLLLLFLFYTMKKEAREEGREDKQK